jgi:hypothetical protein
MAHLLKAKADDSVLRIIRRKQRLRLRLSNVRSGDQTFAHDGRVVLALDQRIGTSLSLRQLDVRQTDTGPRLRLKSS